MMNGSEADTQRDQLLSALTDGEIEPSAVAQVCEQWRHEPSARQRWHDYQLIGDVLRSEDLAATASHDESFLIALRSRLAAEPVVLAPARPLAAEALSMGHSKPAASRRRITTFGAIAAGFMLVVAGALTMTGLPSLLDPANKPTGETLAQSNPANLVSAIESQADPVNELQPTIASGKLIRDARLDRYFSAHQQWSSDAMMAGHAAFLRQSPSDGSRR